PSLGGGMGNTPGVTGLADTPGVAFEAFAGGFGLGGGPNGRRTPRARPPPATAVPTMKLRRERFWFMSRLLSAGGHVHRRPDPLIGAATADVRHRVVDLLVGRLRLLPQQRRRGHDLP